LDLWQGIEPAGDGPCPESWIASAVSSRYDKDPDAGLGVVDGPAFPGAKLRDLVAADPEGMLGSAHAARYGAELAYLAKIIDSDKRLNVQTHPSREKARELFGSPFGKTEAWYVAGGRIVDGAEPYVLLGFKPGITREAWIAVVGTQDREAIAACLHRLEARPGDVFLIESGVPHAIGSGCLIVEIQEPTDITFRVEKMSGPDGPYPDEVYHQGVGFPKLFDCFDYIGYSDGEIAAKARRSPRVAERGPGFDLETLIGREDTPFFGMERLRVRTDYALHLDAAFASAVVLKGSGRVDSGAGGILLKPGTEFFLPRSAAPYVFADGDGGELEILLCRPPLSWR
jgi:mannose-6-phosphate isomerase